MPKRAYSDDNLMPDVSISDDKPSQHKPTNKKIDSLPDVSESKTEVREEDIFDETPRKPTRKKKERPASSRSYKSS